MPTYTVIKGSGSYLPEIIVKNEDFLNNEFLDASGQKIQKENSAIIKKFQEITEIEERRYLEPGLNTSDMAFIASQRAIEAAGIDPETLDYIIVAHNFGEIRHGNKKSDLVPTIASRVKHLLKIENPDCVAYDLPFGCPGWVQGVIQANYFIKSGDAKRALIIGAENLSIGFDHMRAISWRIAQHAECRADNRQAIFARNMRKLVNLFARHPMRVRSFAMGKGHGLHSCLIARLMFTAMDVSMVQVGHGWPHSLNRKC